MTSAKKIYLAVAGGLIAAGIVLAGIGLIASGRDQAVFTTQIDMRDTPSCSAASRWTNPRASRSSAGSPFLARSTPPTSPTPPRPRRNEPGHSVR